MRTTRAKLYEMVWAKPVTRLAQEFGLSDVGFAKMCRKHNIPLPERGYWAKLAAGKQVRKTSLPDPEDDQIIEIHERAPVSEEVKATEKVQREKERQRIDQVGDIKVPPVLESPHRLTQMTQKLYDGIVQKIQRWENVKDLRHPNWNDMPPSAENGRYSCRPPKGFQLTVSLDKLDRALRFLDTLVKALEAYGFKIRNDIKDDKKTYPTYMIEASKDGEGIRFRLSEGYKRRELSPKELEAARKEFSHASSYEMVPSGRFNFTIDGREPWTEKKWSDGSRPLEEYLPAIVAEFIDLVPRQKQIRIDRAKAEKERQELEVQRWEVRRKRENQEDQFNKAIAEAHKFNELELLEAYLKELEARYREANGEMAENVAAWFKLVRTIAQAQNPIASRLQSLKNLEEMGLEVPDWLLTNGFS